MKNKQKYLILSVLFFLIIGVIILNPFNDNKVSSQTDSIFNDLEPFFEAISIVRSEYIEKNINIEQLVQGAIKGMLLELDDPYSRYLDPISFQRERENLFMGHFDGLGIIVTIVDNQLTVISPIEDTPAYQAGIKAGDNIMQIDGEPTKSMSLDDAVNILRGEKGTLVTLTIQREKFDELFEVEIIRDTIMVEAVKEKVIEDERIAYIRISTFNANTGPELKQVLNSYKNSSLSGIIVDLRNNPGGLLDSAIDVASQFIDEGEIVRIKGRNNIIKIYNSYGNDNPQWPVIVLVNIGSASASEIVAGAIQDSGRGIVLGENTFGKGLVQQVYTLADDSAVMVSTSEYYTPSGRVINNIGIEPNILVSQNDDNDDYQLEAAIDYLLKGNVTTK
ncbi:MAG: S41 family peptidase [Atribacterota bacterium]|nr:S41 family peptidase [Atribacterota bacterium]